MALPGPVFATIHPSVYRDTAGPVRGALAIPRSSGAMRYRCPTTGSFVLITEPATLCQLERPVTRLRCMDCGEMHLLTRAGGSQDRDPAAIVADKARP